MGPILQHIKNEIDLNQKNNRPLYKQIAEFLIRQINAETLRPQQSLPSSRSLSTALDINRKTVIKAYELLTIQGWIESSQGSGTFVSKQLESKIKQSFSEKNKRAQLYNQQVPHYNFNKINSDPNKLIISSTEQIDFSTDTPDPRLAPIDLLFNQMKQQHKRSNARKLYQYGDPTGDRILIKKLATKLLPNRGIHVEPNQIMTTKGSVMGFDLILAATIKKNDLVICADPGYKTIEAQVKKYGAHCLPIQVDQDGLDTQAIQNAIEDPLIGKRIKVIYSTPHNHFPTTVQLPAHRRKHLVEIATKNNLLIIEDDYDFDYHYEQDPLLPMIGYGSISNIVYVGSFSKMISPGIRAGFVVGHEAFIKELAERRKIIDRQGDHWTERAIAEMIEDGTLQRYIGKNQKTFIKRRNVLVEILKSEFGGKCKFIVPKGGMAIWTQWSPIINFEEVEFKLNKQGMTLGYNPQWIKDFQGLRLGFASFTPKEIKKFYGILYQAMN